MVALTGSLEMIVKLIKEPLEVYKDIPRGLKGYRQLVGDVVDLLDRGNYFL